MFNKLFTITALSVLLSTSLAFAQADGIKSNSDCEQRATDTNRTIAEHNANAEDLADKDVAKDAAKNEADAEGGVAEAHKGGEEEAAKK